MKHFVAGGMDVNVRDLAGDTPMHWAAWAGDDEMIVVLHTLGGAVGARNNGGDTPLHYAATNSLLEAAKKLVELGAESQCKNSRGHVPHYVARGHAVKRLLLDAGRKEEIEKGEVEDAEVKEAVKEAEKEEEEEESTSKTKSKVTSKRKGKGGKGADAIAAVAAAPPHASADDNRAESSRLKKNGEESAGRAALDIEAASMAGSAGNTQACQSNISQGTTKQADVETNDEEEEEEEQENTQKPGAGGGRAARKGKTRKVLDSSDDDEEENDLNPQPEKEPATEPATEPAKEAAKRRQVRGEGDPEGTPRKRRLVDMDDSGDDDDDAADAPKGHLASAITHEDQDHNAGGNVVVAQCKAAGKGKAASKKAGKTAGKTAATTAGKTAATTATARTASGAKISMQLSIPKVKKGAAKAALKAAEAAAESAEAVAAAQEEPVAFHTPAGIHTLTRTAYVVFGLDVRRQLVAQDLTTVSTEDLRDMIRTGWFEMTKSEKEGYHARAAEATNGVVSLEDIKKHGEDQARAKVLMRDVGAVFQEALKLPDDLC